MFTMPNSKSRLNLDAFNLWVGAVIIPKLDFPNDEAVELFVVTDLIRNADTEEVVVFYRNIITAEVADLAPKLVPFTTVELMPYWRTVLVCGNIVNPQDPDDTNIGTV